jgi:hypothetical protein
MKLLLSTPRWFPLLSMWLFLGLGVTCAQEATPKKPLKVEDLYLLEDFRSPVLFPNEDKLVHERVWIDAKTKMDRHSLWLVSETRDARKPLEEGEPDGRSPVISPDGQWIAFLSARPDTFAPFRDARGGSCDGSPYRRSSGPEVSHCTRTPRPWVSAAGRLLGE